MNGAITVPWLIISKPPINKSVKIIGSNQSFFLVFKNLKISIINDIIYTFKGHIYGLIHLKKIF